MRCWCWGLLVLLSLHSVFVVGEYDGNDEEHPDDDPLHPQSHAPRAPKAAQDILTCNICQRAVAPALRKAVEESKEGDDFEKRIIEVLHPLSRKHAADLATGEVIAREKAITGESDAELDEDVHDFVTGLLGDHDVVTSMVAVFHLWHSAPNRRHLWDHLVDLHFCPCDDAEHPTHPTHSEEFRHYIDRHAVHVHSTWKARGGHQGPAAPEGGWVEIDGAAAPEDGPVPGDFMPGGEGDGVF